MPASRTITSSSESPGALAPVPAGQDDALTVDRGPRCRVCGYPIQAGNIVYCASCESPHHADCFEFAGGCALFGCGQKRYRLRPRGKAQSLVVTPAAHAVRVDAHTRLRGLAMGVGAAGMGLAGVEMLACTVAPALVVLLLAYPPLLVAAVLAPASLLAGSAVMALADTSHFRYDPASDSLELVSCVAGMELGRKVWPAGDIDRLELYEPYGPGGGAVWLTVVTRAGERLHVASDHQHLGRGYDEADLVRMGNRLAQALKVPFTHHAPVSASDKQLLP